MKMTAPHRLENDLKTRRVRLSVELDDLRDS